MYVSTGEDNLKKAEEYLANFINRTHSYGQTSCLLPSEMPILQVLDDYARFKIGQPSAKRLSYSMEHLLNFWGDNVVSYINVENIRRYCTVNKRASGTLKRELTDLRSAINHAVVMSRLHAFNFPKIPLNTRRKECYLTRDEVAQLLREARREYSSKFTLSLFIIIGYYSGARKSAIFNLKWEQVNFVTNMLDFRDLEVDRGNNHRARIPILLNYAIFYLDDKKIWQVISIHISPEKHPL